MRPVATLAAALVALAVTFPARAAEDPVPLNKIFRETGESLVVDTLGKLPLGTIPVAIYKVADFGREIGVAAVEKEEKTRDGEVVLMRADAALLKGLVARGEGNSPKAEEAKARLRQLRDQLDSQDPGDINYLLNVTAKNFGYAVGKASLKFALKEGISKFLKQDPAAKFIRKYMHFGDEPASIIGNRSALRPVLSKLGWRKFGARAALVERYVDKVTDKLIDKFIAGEGSKFIAGISAEAMDRLYEQVMAGHPPEPIIYTRVRRAIAINPVYAPLVAPAAAIPILAAAPAPVAAAPAPQAAFQPDRVARTITIEDHYVQADFAVERSGPSTYQSTDVPPAAPEPEQPSAADLERRRERHEELMCVGAGNKAGCERWNSSSGGKVQGTWDGSKYQTDLSDR